MKPPFEMRAEINNEIAEPSITINFNNTWRPSAILLCCEKKELPKLREIATEIEVILRSFLI
jgi:hypothetical protein